MRLVAGPNLPTCVVASSGNQEPHQHVASRRTRQCMLATSLPAHHSTSTASATSGGVLQPRGWHNRRSAAQWHSHAVQAAARDHEPVGSVEPGGVLMLWTLLASATIQQGGSEAIAHLSSQLPRALSECSSLAELAKVLNLCAQLWGSSNQLWGSSNQVFGDFQCSVLHEKLLQLSATIASTGNSSTGDTSPSGSSSLTGGDSGAGQSTLDSLEHVSRILSSVLQLGLGPGAVPAGWEAWLNGLPDSSNDEFMVALEARMKLEQLNNPLTTTASTAEVAAANDSQPGAAAAASTARRHTAAIADDVGAVGTIGAVGAVGAAATAGLHSHAAGSPTAATAGTESVASCTPAFMNHVKRAVLDASSLQELEGLLPLCESLQQQSIALQGGTDRVNWAHVAIRAHKLAIQQPLSATAGAVTAAKDLQSLIGVSSWLASHAAGAITVCETPPELAGVLLVYCKVASHCCSRQPNTTIPFGEAENQALAAKLSNSSFLMQLPLDQYPHSACADLIRAIAHAGKLQLTPGAYPGPFLAHIAGSPVQVAVAEVINLHNAREARNILQQPAGDSNDSSNTSDTSSNGSGSDGGNSGATSSSGSRSTTSSSSNSGSGGNNVEQDSGVQEMLKFSLASPPPVASLPARRLLFDYSVAGASASSQPAGTATVAATAGSHTDGGRVLGVVTVADSIVNAANGVEEEEDQFTEPVVVRGWKSSMSSTNSTSSTASTSISTSGTSSTSSTSIIKSDAASAAAEDTVKIDDLNVRQTVAKASSLQQLEGLLPRCQRAQERLVASTGAPDRALWVTLATRAYQLAKQLSHAATGSGERQSLSAVAVWLIEHAAGAMTMSPTPTQLTGMMKGYCNVAKCCSAHQASVAMRFGGAERQALAAKLTDPLILDQLVSPAPLEWARDLVYTIVQAGKMNLLPGPIPSPFLAFLSGRPELSMLVAVIEAHDRGQVFNLQHQPAGGSSSSPDAHDSGSSTNDIYAAVQAMLQQLSPVCTQHDFEALLPQCQAVIEQALAAQHSSSVHLWLKVSRVALRVYLQGGNLACDSKPEPRPGREVASPPVNATTAKWLQQHFAAVVTACDTPEQLAMSLLAYCNSIANLSFGEPERQALAAKLSDPAVLQQLSGQPHAVVGLVSAIMHAGALQLAPGQIPTSFIVQLSSLCSRELEASVRADIEKYNRSQEQHLAFRDNNAATAPQQCGSNCATDSSDSSGSSGTSTISGTSGISNYGIYPAVSSVITTTPSVTSLQGLGALLPECQRVLDCAIALQYVASHVPWQFVGDAVLRLTKARPLETLDSAEKQALADITLWLFQNTAAVIRCCQRPSQLLTVLRSYLSVSANGRVPFDCSQRQAIAATLCNPLFLAYLSDQRQATRDLLRAIMAASDAALLPGPFPAPFLVHLEQLSVIGEHEKGAIQEHNRKEQQDTEPALIRAWKSSTSHSSTSTSGTSTTSSSTSTSSSRGHSQADNTVSSDSSRLNAMASSVVDLPETATAANGRQEKGHAQAAAVSSAAAATTGSSQEGAAVSQAGTATTAMPFDDSGAALYLVKQALNETTNLQQIEALLPQCTAVLRRALREQPNVGCHFWRQPSNTVKRVANWQMLSAPDNASLVAIADWLHQHAAAVISACDTPQRLSKVLWVLANIWSSCRVPFNAARREALTAKLSEPLFLGRLSDPENLADLVGLITQAGRRKLSPGPFPEPFLVRAGNMTRVDRAVLAAIQEHNHLQKYRTSSSSFTEFGVGQERYGRTGQSNGASITGGRRSSVDASVTSQEGAARSAPSASLPANLHALKDMADLGKVSDFLSRLLKFVQQQGQHVSPSLLEACEREIASALGQAAAMWRGEPMPGMQDVESLSSLMSQGLAVDPDGGGSEDDLEDGWWEEEEGDTMELPSTVVRASQELEDSGDDVQERSIPRSSWFSGSGDEEEEEEDEFRAERDAERDEVLLVSARVLAKLGRNLTPSASASILWSLFALGMQTPLGKGSRASVILRSWIDGVCSCIQYKGRRAYTTTSSIKQTFLDQAEQEGLVPSLMLGLHLSGACWRPVRVLLASHSIEHMDGWTSAQARAAVRSCVGRLPQAEEQVEIDMIRAFEHVIVKAKDVTGCLGDVETSTSLAEWIMNHTRSNQRTVVLEMLSNAARRLPLGETLLVMQLALSHFSSDDEDDLDLEDRRILARFLSGMMAFLSGRTNALVGQQSLLHTLHPAKLVQLAELNARQEVLVREYGKDVWKASPDQALMIRLCEAVKPHRQALDVASLMAFARALIATKEVHRDYDLIDQIVMDVGMRGRELDADVLADCVLKQAQARTALGYAQTTHRPRTDHAQTLLSSTIRDARYKLDEMSLTGLLTLLVAISILSQAEASRSQYSSDADDVCDRIVAKLGDTGVLDGQYLIDLAATALNRMDHYHPELLTKLCNSVNQAPLSSPPINHTVLSTVVKAVASLGLDGPGTASLFQQTGQRVADNLHTIPLRVLTRYCWSFAVANQNPTVELSKQWLLKRDTFEPQDADSSTRGSEPRRARAKRTATLVELLVHELQERRQQIVSWNSKTAAGEVKYALRIWAVLFPEIKIDKALMVDVHAIRDSRKRGASKVQMDIMDVLRNKTPTLRKVDMEANVGNHWVVDMIARHHATGRTIYFEVDGPLHFASNKPDRRLGSTTIRNLCLRTILERDGAEGVLVLLELHSMSAFGDGTWESSARVLGQVLQRKIDEALGQEGGNDSASDVERRPLRYVSRDVSRIARSGSRSGSGSRGTPVDGESRSQRASSRGSDVGLSRRSQDEARSRTGGDRRGVALKEGLSAAKRRAAGVRGESDGDDVSAKGGEVGRKGGSTSEPSGSTAPHRRGTSAAGETGVGRAASKPSNAESRRSARPESRRPGGADKDGRVTASKALKSGASDARRSVTPERSSWSEPGGTPEPDERSPAAELLSKPGRRLRLVGRP